MNSSIPHCVLYKKLLWLFMAIMLLGGFILAVPLLERGLEVAWWTPCSPSFSTVLCDRACGSGGRPGFQHDRPAGRAGAHSNRRTGDHDGDFPYLYGAERFSLSDRLTMQESLNEDKLQSLLPDDAPLPFLTGCELAGGRRCCPSTVQNLDGPKGYTTVCFRGFRVHCNHEDLTFSAGDKLHAMPRIRWCSSPLADRHWAAWGSWW